MSARAIKSNVIRLKGHPRYNEAWLQQQIAEDPSILGLGDVQVISRERRQDSGGRLDMLLGDFTSDTRYEVELQLGATDEKHIIRCLEYWDIESKRYPAYDHCAVLVAEDITSRFLNILSLFNGQIPIIGIQLSAIEHAGEVLLHAVRVVDRASLRLDDEAEAESRTTDRAYWETKVGAAKMRICDAILGMVNDASSRPLELGYKAGYVGLQSGGRADNFIHFHPKRSLFRLLIELKDPEAWTTRLDDAGLEYETRKRFMHILLDEPQVRANETLLREMVSDAVKARFGDE